MVFGKTRGRPTTQKSLDTLREQLAAAEARAARQESADTETAKILEEGFQTLRSQIPQNVRIGVSSKTPATSLLCKLARALADVQRFSQELVNGNLAVESLENLEKDFQSGGNEILAEVVSGELTDEEGAEKAREFVEKALEFDSAPIDRIQEAREAWESARNDGREIFGRISEEFGIPIPEKFMENPFKIGLGKN